MFLSKLYLNPRNRGALVDIARPYELHRTLMRVCAEPQNADGDARILFRIELTSTLEQMTVLVQTPGPIGWEPIIANGYLLRALGPKQVKISLRPGQWLQFRLVANPVKKVAEEGRKHSKRIPLVFGHHSDPNVTTYFDWLERKAALHGFAVERVQDTPFQIGGPREGGISSEKTAIPHFGVRFDGILRVNEPAKVMQAIRQGIGTARAFGFGLLTLAPLS